MFVTLRIRYRRPESVIGRHNVTELLLSRSGSVKVHEYCDTDVHDGFVEPPEDSEFTDELEDLFLSFDSAGKKMGRDYSSRPCEGDVTFSILATDENGKTTETVGNSNIPPFLEKMQRLAESTRTSLVFEPMKEKIRPYSAGQLNDLLSSGLISHSKFDEMIAQVNERKRHAEEVASHLENGDYADVAEPKAIVSDLREGLITEKAFNSFVWHKREIGTDGKNRSVISFKLKISVWGLKFAGKYDTFEYNMESDDKALSERCYCIHGTLFEGCGNYRAPDAPRYIPMTDAKRDRVFGFIQTSFDKGLLEKDYRGLAYDCGFFDLYVRFSDRDSIHTKGTSDYPDFIRYLMTILNLDRFLD